MDELELEWLAERASKCQRIVEIGSWEGRSTTAMAANTSGLLFAVDTWKGSAEHPKALVGPEGQLFDRFRKNTKALPILAVQMPSIDAAALFARGGLEDFDMIFIDGSHIYEDVKADIKSWWPLLSANGLLCGHDIDRPEVKQAVTELVGSFENPVMRIWAKWEGL